MVSPKSLLILVITTLTLAAPMPEPQVSTDVFKRATITDVICGTPPNEVRYTAAEVEKALNALKVNMNKPRRNKPQNDDGTKVCPHEFKTEDETRSPDVLSKLENSPNSKKKIKNTSYLEFPLMHNKYQGGNPELDRVVAIVYGQKVGDYSDVHFSMAVTHRGATGWNELVPCRPA